MGVFIIFRIAICNDDSLYMDKIEEYIFNFLERNEAEIYRYTTTESFLADIEKSFDLIFLDYKIDERTGIDIATKIREINKNTLIVFLTGVIDPEPIFFEINTFRFIRKSTPKKKISMEIGMIIDHLIERNRLHYLIVQDKSNFQKVPISKILYIAKYKKSSLVYVYEKNGTYTLRTKESIMDIYDIHKDLFEYAHSSYIVNIENITRITNDDITLKDGTILNISRSKKSTFHARMTQYIKNKYKR